MRSSLLLFFCLWSALSFGQFHLIWANPNEDLTFLKKERSLKVEFNMDSLKIYYATLEKPTFTDTPEPDKKDFYNDIKTTLMTSFNKKKKMKLYDSINDISFNYILKITPLKFYGEEAYYNDLDYANGQHAPAQTSIYFKADYLFELYLKNDRSTLLRSFMLTNLTNPGPICSFISDVYRSRSKRPYIKNIGFKKAIVISSKRAGTESSKYILKLMKGTPKKYKNLEDKTDTPASEEITPR